MSTKRIGEDMAAAGDPVESPASTVPERSSRLLRKPAEMQAAAKAEFANPFVRRPAT
jgi:hypothetical protein